MNAPARFTKADIARILKGAKEAAVHVRVRIEPTGAIEVLTVEASQAQQGGNPLDRVL
jgi:hypothetical protein